jgi:hypothetical protein
VDPTTSKLLGDAFNGPADISALVHDSSEVAIAKETSWYWPDAAQMLPVADVYWRSMFCPHPYGDSFTRKAMVDALALGCIPVFTNEEQRSLWPWFWGSWIYNASVFLSVDSILSRRVDLVSELEKIPAASIERMQQVIAEHAHELQYNAVDSAALRAAADDAEGRRAHLEGHPSPLPLKDGFEIVLARAWELSRSKPRQSFGRLQQKRAGRWVTNRASGASVANSDTD